MAIIDNDYVESALLFDVFDEIIACDRELRGVAEGDEEAMQKTVHTGESGAWF